jgi:hypothetical protein
MRTGMSAFSLMKLMLTTSSPAISVAEANVSTTKAPQIKQMNPYWMPSEMGIQETK